MAAEEKTKKGITVIICVFFILLFGVTVWVVKGAAAEKSTNQKIDEEAKSRYEAQNNAAFEQLRKQDTETSLQVSDFLKHRAETSRNATQEYINSVYAEQHIDPIVYISAFGECYHTDPKCSGMGRALSVTLQEATETMYRTPCSICIGGIAP